MLNDPAIAAQSGVDFLSANGGFSIAAGDTSYQLPVTVVSDIMVETDELFNLMVNASFSGPVSSASAASTILNDDVAPVVSAAGPALVNEGGTYPYTFQVTAKGSFIVSMASCGSGSLVGSVTTNQDPAGGGTGSLSCFFANGPNNTQVKVQVQSGGASSNVGTVDVTVVNVAPVVNLTGVQIVDTGAIITYLFSVTDVGGDAFFTSPLYPSCGATGWVVDGSLALDALGGSFQCIFGSGVTTSQVSIKVTDVDGADSAIASLVVTINAPTTQYWMISHGTLPGDIHIASSLSCMAGEGPKNLHVFIGAHKFRMEKLTSSTCFDDPTIDPGKPSAPFDTIQGTGTGRYDNVTGYTIAFKFADAGDPGVNDTAQIKITDPQGNVVLDVTGVLLTGNINTQP
jgi:hypothetical protein